MQIYKTREDITEALEHLSAHDDILAGAFKTYATPPMRESPDGFHGLVRLLISQQVSTAAAASIQAKFNAAMGDMQPENLLALSDAELGACGISRPKQRYMRLLAEAIVSDGLDLAALRDAEDGVVYDTLIQLTGIGPWTAQCYLLFALRRADMFPAGDLALQQAVRLLYGLDERPDAQALAEFALRWQPHRGAAARLLWTYYNGEQEAARQRR